MMENISPRMIHGCYDDSAHITPLRCCEGIKTSVLPSGEGILTHRRSMEIMSRAFISHDTSQRGARDPMEPLIN